MRKWLVVYLFLITPLLLFFTQATPVWAEGSDECSGKSGQEKIACYEAVLDKYQGQIKNFSNEINKRKTQISLTTAKIFQTESEIEVLAGKISRLEVSLDSLSTALGQRIVTTYKQGAVDPLSLFLSSENFSTFLSRYEYLRIIQMHDRKLLLAMEETRTNFDDQRKESEKLKKQLENQKVILSQQQKELEFLLDVTRNQAKTYQDLLAKALAEQAATMRAMARAIVDLREGKGEQINAGDLVGFMGNSGHPDCSTGAHLHFTVLKDGAPQNPAGYLKNGPFIWNNPDTPLSFTGAWDWPLSNPRITQSYGETYYARIFSGYAGNFHNGIDMVSADENIRAPKAGKIIRGTTTCSSRQGKSSILKFAAIGHDNGLISLYLHIQ